MQRIWSFVVYINKGRRDRPIFEEALMFQFQIISDGPCDFTREEAADVQVGLVPPYITFDHETYLKEGVDISTVDYFKRLSEDKNLRPKTAQPNPQDYIEAYTPFLQAGQDILVLTISTNLSGSNSSAKMAAEMVKEEYPNRTIAIVDSQSVTIGEGLILREVIRMRDAGLSLEEAVALTEKVRATTRAYFTLDTLDYLKRGGRVGPTTALIGGILGMRPILQVQDGAISQLESVRGKKQALALMEEAIVETLSDVKDEINICVGHILNEEEAGAFKANAEAKLGVAIDTPLTLMSASVGTHAGPGVVGFAYCRKYDTLKSEKDVVA